MISSRTVLPLLLPSLLQRVHRCLPCHYKYCIMPRGGTTSRHARHSGSSLSSLLRLDMLCLHTPEAKASRCRPWPAASVQRSPVLLCFFVSKRYNMVRAALAFALLFVAASELSELPEDCEDSEGSLSLRQLRGEQTLASVSAHQADPFAEPEGIDDTVDEPVKPKVPVVEADDWGNMTQEAWEEKQGGSCCFSADDPNNVCGTCFPTAVASFRNNCARKSTCASCGGSWCEPKCVMGAADPNDKCGTAFETGTAKSDTYCGKSAKNCASCNGEWCKRGVTKKVPKEESKVTTVSAVSNVQGFCCYRGNGLAKNMCGGCADVSQDAACASSKGCGSCGGTWCPGPRPEHEK